MHRINLWCFMSCFMPAMGPFACTWQIQFSQGVTCLRKSNVTTTRDEILCCPVNRLNVFRRFLSGKCLHLFCVCSIVLCSKTKRDFIIVSIAWCFYFGCKFVSSGGRRFSYLFLRYALSKRTWISSLYVRVWFGNPRMCVWGRTWFWDWLSRCLCASDEPVTPLSEVDRQKEFE